jgi:hypothetical protein
MAVSSESKVATDPGAEMAAPPEFALAGLIRPLSLGPRVAPGAPDDSISMSPSNQTPGRAIGVVLAPPAAPVALTSPVRARRRARLTLAVNRPRRQRP